ncbi:MAG: trimethylamine methyltransferase family protein [Desulfohalobiaceae bacterium]|nr:trimethylamine methyltransferase family protein [Desulfohalobiaceae bacterium]
MSDVQVGHEKTLTGLIPALAGANMLYGLGMLESGITFDYGQLVLDCEFARMIKKTIQGFAVTDDSLALDVIREVGQFGEFLTHEHTFRGMRGQSRPELIDRRTRSAWENSGRPDIRERAMDKVRHILETHEPEPLPDGVREELRAIVAETEQEE